MSGWIKIHRKLLDWEWYSDTNCRLLFLHCLILANFEDTKWRGIEIKKGSFISSLGNLAKSSGLSLQSLRTSISNLQSTGELTSKGHAEYTMFTVVKYNLYQSTNMEVTRKPTKKQQSINTELTTVKEEEEFKEEKEIKNNIPTFEMFSLYATEKKPTVCLVALKTKYDTWVELGWHTGKEKPIKNWKVVLLNTLQYLPEQKWSPPKNNIGLTPEQIKRNAERSVL